MRHPLCWTAEDCLDCSVQLHQKLLLLKALYQSAGLKWRSKRAYAALQLTHLPVVYQGQQESWKAQAGARKLAEVLRHPGQPTADRRWVRQAVILRPVQQQEQQLREQERRPWPDTLSCWPWLPWQRPAVLFPVDEPDQLWFAHKSAAQGWRRLARLPRAM